VASRATRDHTQTAPTTGRGDRTTHTGRQNRGAQHRPPARPPARTPRHQQAAAALGFGLPGVARARATRGAFSLQQIRHPRSLAAIRFRAKPRPYPLRYSSERVILFATVQSGRLRGDRGGSFFRRGFVGSSPLRPLLAPVWDFV
jgi:hypothetical protein